MLWDEAATPTLVTDAGGPLLRGGTVGHDAHGSGVLQYESCGAWVVAAWGEFDMGSISPLADVLKAAVDKHPKVVLDASGITFADSTLPNLLIVTHQIGALRVASPSAWVRRLLEITGVDSYLEIRDTVKDAATS
ncbi:STAS domain-containing protein [Streptomyces huasconensis]|uniref:STAS domain-containing protein n=1 Tax=Streptomyces huasconensis TaxID=1854574 RepID=UPI0033C77FF4